MKHMFKKNQIIITLLTVMIAVAGYLNYSGKLFGSPDKNSTEANAELANKELLDISEEDIEEDEKQDIASNDSEVDGVPGEAVLTNGTMEATVARAKVAREQVRAQNKETLQELIDNTEISEEEKQSAIEQMIKMTDIAEKEMAIETLMASKGFSDSVVNLTEDSADIVVNSRELSEANRAQIEDIVVRKTDISPEKIVITPVTEKNASK